MSDKENTKSHKTIKDVTVEQITRLLYVFGRSFNLGKDGRSQG